MVNELAPCIFFGDALTTMEFADAMYLGRPPRSTVTTCQWKMKKLFMGLRGANSLEAIEERDDPSMGSSHGSLQICAE
jgi:hypothetical protein